MLRNLLGNNHKDDLVLGRTGSLDLFPKFRISAQVRQFHTYVVGLTGRGKSKFLQNCILQDIHNGRGCALVDPHGDLAKDILQSLITSGYFNTQANYERLLYVSPRRRDYIIPFNVLEKPDPQIETYEVCQRVISAFMRAWSRTLLEPPRFQQIMRAGLAVLVETKKTLCDLYNLLTDDEYRNALIEQIPDPKVKLDCQTFFYNEFDRWGRERSSMISSTTNKVNALTDNPNLFYMLGQQENHINIQKIMDSGKVLLVDLGECDNETKRLFGTLIVTGFEQAALSRARLFDVDRKPYYLYIDEFQDFACHPGSAETFSQMLSQVRKFGLHMILANQSIAQLNPRLQTALGNAQTIISFRVSRADAEVLSRVLGKVNPEQIKHDQQIDIQHPLYSPLNEQWEGFIQHLTSQSVRQATVKTADDRLAVIWSEKMKNYTVPQDTIEKVIIESLKRNGLALNSKNQNSNSIPINVDSNCVFAY